MADQKRLPVQGDGGGKGGSGGSTGAQEYPNTLRAKSTARILDLLGEGPIVGLVENEKGIVFDGTPLKDALGNINHQGVVWHARNGYPDQEHIVGFDGVESETSVSTEVKFGIPVTRSLTDSDFNAVRVKVLIPALSDQDTTTGDLKGSTVSYTIRVTSDVGGETQSLSDTVTGKTVTNYIRSYRLQLPGDAPWTVTVTRDTADAVASTLQNKTFFSSYATIIDGKYAYPDSALVGLEVDAQLFGGSVPSRGYLVDGLIIQVPANYNVTERTYATTGTGTSGGTWDGTFVNAWTDNPAWVLYDILTNTRYGLGLAPSKIDIGAFYTIAQYADQLIPATISPYYVDNIADDKTTAVRLVVNTNVNISAPGATLDGKTLVSGNRILLNNQTVGSQNGVYVWTGAAATMSRSSDLNQSTELDGAAFRVTDGTYAGKWFKNHYAGTINVFTPKWIEMEPRYRFNYVFQSREEAYKVIQAIAGSFRGMCYWSAGAVTVVADMPSDPVKLVTPSNVVDGKFTYQGTSMKARHSVAAVTWNDPADSYKPAIEVVEDQSSLELYGHNQLDITLVGVTSRTEAYRFGKWALDTERTGTEVVTYRAFLDHADVVPGDVVEIADPAFAGVRQGGRVLAVNAAKTQITLDDSLALGVETYTLSVTMQDGGVEVRTVSGNALVNGLRVITVSAAFTGTIVEGSVWVLSGDVEPRQFRLMAIKELEDGTYEVNGVLHDPTKYDRIEEGATVAPSNFTRIAKDGTVSPPSTLTVVKTDYYVNNQTRTRLTFSWSAPSDPLVTDYEVRYIAPGELYARPVSAAGMTFEISDALIGEYTFAVRSVTSDGRTSEYATSVYVNGGKVTAPDAPTSLTAVGGYNQIALAWVLPTNRDIAYTEIFAHTSNSRNSATKVGQASSDKFIHTGLATNVTRYYWVRCVDTSQNVGAYNAGTTSGVAGTTIYVDAGELDYNTMAVPTSLSLTNQVEVDSQGNGTLQILATWSANVDPDFGMFEWAWRDQATSNWSYGSSRTNQYVIKPVSNGKTYEFKVRAVNLGGDASAYSSVSSLTAVGDTTPPATTATPTLTAGFRTVVLAWTANSEVDFSHYWVYRNTTNSSGTATRVGQTYINSYVDDGLATGTQYYYWLKSVDKTGNASAFSTGANVTTGQLVSADIADGSVVAAKIASAVIDATKFASSIRPVEIFATTVAAGTATQGRTIFVTGDNKLYRGDGTNWIATVPTTDLSGTITAAQIASGVIDATKLSTGLSAIEKFSSLPSTGNFQGRTIFLTTDGKLYRWTDTSTTGTTFWSAAVPTTDLTGTVTSAQIAAGAVLASKLGVGDTSNMFPDPQLMDTACFSGDPFTLITAPSDAGPSLNEMNLSSSSTDKTVLSVPIAVETGKPYLLSFWGETTSSGGTATADASVNWYSDITGTTLISNTVIGSGTTNVPTRKWVVATAPATARTCRWQFFKVGSLGKSAKFSAPVMRPAADVELLASGSVDLSKFASGVAPIEKVAALPSTGNFQGRVIMLTTDGKLYRWTDTSTTGTTFWTAAVPTADLTGTISNAQIAAAAIDATKFASAVKPVEVLATLPVSGNTDGRMVFLTTDKKLYRYNATTSTFVTSVPTSDLTGTIANAQIAAGAVTASKVYLGDTSNMVPDPTMTDPACYTGTFTFVATGTAYASDNYLRLTNTATVDEASTTSVPVEISKPYFFSIALSVLDTGTNTVSAYADWFSMSSGGTLTLIQSDLIGTYTGTGNGNVRSATITSPSTARRVKMRFVKGNTVSTAGGGFSSPVIRRSTDLDLINTGAIDASKFASGVAPIEKFSSLPSTGNFQGRVVMLSTDGKLYRWTDTSTTGTTYWTAAVPTTDLTGTITAAQIASGAIDATKLSTGLSAVEKFSSLPSTGNFQGRTIFLTTDGKLYRWTDTSTTGTTYWTAAVPTTDLTGTVTGAQIAAAALDATKFASTIKPVEIFATTGAAGTATQGRTIFVTGDNKLYRGNGTSWIATVATTDLSGTISNAQIAAGAVDAGKIASSAIDATKFASTIKPVEIFATTGAAGAATQGRTIFVTGDNKLYRGDGSSWVKTVDGADIIAGSITAGKIAVGAISASEIAAGSITASKLVVTDGQNMLPDGTLADAAAWTHSGWGLVNEPTATTNGFRVPWYVVAPTGNGTTSQGDGDYSIAVPIPVEPGKPYRVTAKAVYNTGYTGTMYIAVLWYRDQVNPSSVSTASFVFPALHDHRTVAATTGSAAYDMEGIVTAPSDATAAYFRIGCAWSSTLTNASNGYAAMPRMYRAANADLIVDGAITAAKIAAGTITANEISSGAITTAKLAAGAVTANEIAANTITAAKIAVGTITATEIAADTITAGQIATGAISADEIAANAVTASKLYIGDTSNMFPDPEMVDTGIYSGGSFSLNNVASDGGQSLKQLQITSSSSAVTITTVPIPVEKTKSYMFSLWAEITGSGGTATADASVNWYSDVAGTTLISNTVIGSGTSSTPSRKIVTVAAPSTAKSCRWQFFKAASTGRSAVFSGPVMRPAADGELVVDGTITGTKIAATTITASNIAAGTITATQIASNTITAGQIAADTITAGQIAASAITTTELAAGAVTAAKITAGTITSAEIAADTITAGNIAANAITTTELAAGAVTAAKITAGTITANEIAASGITASRLYIGDTSNIYVDPTLSDANALALGGFTQIADTTVAASARVLAVPGLSGTGNVTYSVPFPAEANIPYFFSAYMGNAGGAGSASIYVDWFGLDTSTGNYTYLTGIHLGTETANILSQYKTVQITAPSNARAMRFAYLNGAGTTSVTAYFHSPVVRRATTGSLVVDGTITGSKVAANTITATNIAASTITATEIAASTITASKIAAGTITATEIAANTITAAKIAAGTITTTEIAAGTITASDIAANTITAGQIAAGTITATEIAAGSISANRLLIGDTTNFAENNDFALGNVGWDLQTNSGTGPTITNSISGAAYRGTYYAYLMGSGGIRNRGWMRVSPGDNLYAYAYVNVTNATGGSTASVRISYINSASAEIAVSATGNSVNSSGGYTTYERVETVGVVPAGAMYARVEVFYSQVSGEIFAGMAGLMRRATGSLIVDGSITTAKLVAGAVTANEIAAGTITAAKIASNTITASQIASDTITSAQIAANAISTSELAAGAVTAAKITAGTITSNEIASNTIVAGNIAAGTITATQIAANTITAGQIAANTITSGQIAADTITAGQIAASAITTSELAAGAVTAAKITAGAITSNEIASATITAGNIASGTITATQIASDTITAGQIAAAAIGVAELAAGAVTASKIVVTDGYNLVPDTTLGDAASWNVNGVWGLIYEANGVTNGFHTDYYLASPVGNGTTSQSGGYYQSAKLFPVEKNKPYRVHAKAVVSHGFTGVLYIIVFWYKDLTNQSSITGASYVYPGIHDYRGAANAGGASYDLEGLITAPADAVYARFSLNIDWSTSINNASTGYVAAPRMYRADAGDLTVDGAITTSKLAANAVTAAKIAAGTITANEIATDAITASKILAGTITGAKISSNTITASNIQAGTITATEIAGTTITAAKIASGTITATQIAAGTITATEIAANTITAAKIAAGTITATEIASATITGGKIAASTITASNLSVSSLSAITADLGTVTAGTIRNSGSTFVIDVANGKTTTTAGSYTMYQGNGFGSSSDLIMWFGAAATAIGSATKTNGVWALATDGKFYYGGAELVTGGSSAIAKQGGWTGSGTTSGTTALQFYSLSVTNVPTTPLIELIFAPNPATFSCTGGGGASWTGVLTVFENNGGSDVQMYDTSGANSWPFAFYSVDPSLDTPFSGGALLVGTLGGTVTYKFKVARTTGSNTLTFGSGVYNYKAIKGA